MLIASHHGLGDTGASSSAGFDWSLAGGSVLTAAILGIGLIIAMHTVLEPSSKRRGKKQWIRGAYRSPDYETYGPNFTDYRNRKGKRSKAA